MEQRIVEFINEHHLLTFAAAGEGDLWCASTFYVFNPDTHSFIITSDENTRHIQRAIANNPEPIIAGTIALETEKIGMIRGVQFRAKLRKSDDGLLDSNRILYLKRFPYAILKGGDLWILELTELKFTDNRLGFGKKLYWEKS